MFMLSVWKAAQPKVNPKPGATTKGAAGRRVSAVLDQQTDSVVRTLARHIKFHFDPRAAASFQMAEIVWCRWEEIGHIASQIANAIIIPINPLYSPPDTSWDVTFRDTRLILWNRIAVPDDGWRPDNEAAPLWYVGPNGLHMPAWDLVGTIFDLLTMGEEVRSPQRDRFGRSVAAMSPRAAMGRLDVPMINNCAAVLVDQCMRLVHGDSVERLPFVRPLTVCLSHDLDQLRGDDMWTVLAGLWRAISPIRQGRLPGLAALKTLMINVAAPRRYFMDDLLSMIAVEAKLGYRSISYVLCGRRGRYGARTSTKHIRQYLPEIASHCEIGVHYNHDTLNNEREFRKQKQIINGILRQVPKAGRAHYLFMDPQTSFHYWAEQGMVIDESLGYPDAVGYRAGIAGTFRPYDMRNGTELPITCLPLVAMDSAIAAQFGSDYLAKTENMVRHLSIVGGTFTLLFHPGMFSNPAHPETAGMYDRLLKLFKSYGAVSLTPGQLLIVEPEIESG